MNEPSATDAEKCLTLRRKSKRGDELNDADLAFISSMIVQYPDWYRLKARAIFVETAPVGSRVEDV